MYANAHCTRQPQNERAMGMQETHLLQQELRIPLFPEHVQLVLQWQGACFDSTH